MCFLPVGVVVPYMMCSDMFQQSVEESRYLLCCSEGMCVSFETLITTLVARLFIIKGNGLAVQTIDFCCPGVGSKK